MLCGRKDIEVDREKGERKSLLTIHISDALSLPPGIPLSLGSAMKTADYKMAIGQ